MRVLLLFPHYGSLEQSGSLRSPQIATYLVGRGHEVTVIAPGVDLRTGRIFPEVQGKSFDDRVVDGVRVIRPSGVEDFRRSMARRLRFECDFALRAARLFGLVPRPDVVMGAYPPAVLPHVGLLYCRWKRIPFVFEVRDLMADALVANRYSRSRLFNRVAVLLERAAYRYSSHVVTVSDGITRAIVEKGVPASKITAVKNGYEPQVFATSNDNTDPRTQFGWGNKFVAIYAGALTQAYDIPTMLRAAELARGDAGILFVILGEGERKAAYQAYCRERSLSNVQFLGLVPRRVIPSILSRANVGLHLFPDNPLWSYVLGNKPFDYLGSGLPMIFSGTGDTADLVRRADAGLVVHPERPGELYEKIVWLKNHPDEALAMGERGKEYVETQCHRFVLLKELDRALEEAVGQG